ncbi:hypothetical protein [Limnoglobus roseus]|uniref:Uncharacterized protein n=1 Tax=Limnoglobus roseus TaxID=2598579 RepID=A0A5C1AMX5_9BACT|nr:hypothetical protein [Limnoglobus roseus]QEL18554.1 hypothetical protein PX52LOC_05584 [Limnoglobus roseus]
MLADIRDFLNREPTGEDFAQEMGKYVKVPDFTDGLIQKDLDRLSGSDQKTK